MTAYYVRADGTAASVAVATGPASSASACMNLTVFNAASDNFQPGDVVYFSGLGGEFTTETTKNSVIAAIHITSVGTLSAPVQYRAVDNCLINLQASANAAACFYVFHAQYAMIHDFQMRGSGRLGAMKFAGTAGTTGDGYNVEAINCSVLANYNSGDGTFGNDGFSLGDTSQVIFRAPYARGCRENPVLTGSNQALTTHTSAKAIAYDVDFSDCGHCSVNTLSSSIIIDRGTVSDMKIATCSLGGDAAADSVHIVRNATVLCTSGIAYQASGAAAAAKLLIENCNTTMGVGSGQALSKSTLEISGGTIVQNAGYFTAYTSGALIGTISFTGGVDITLAKSAGGIFARADATGGRVKFDNFTLRLNDATTLAVDLRTGPAGGCVRNGVVEKNSSATGTAFGVLVGYANPIEFTQNTFVDKNATGKMTCIGMASNTQVHIIANNIFDNVADAISEPGANAVVTGNRYYNCTAETGTLQTSGDPQFTDRAARDYSLIAGGSATMGGARWWTAAGRRPNGADGNPFPDYEISVGPAQSRTTPSYPR